ncbi:MAG: PIN domain-containing protein [Pseudomonadota bacterium]
MTRVLIDACVLYPTVMREVVLGVASEGVFTPLWSDRILEEWARAAARIGEEATARAEIALLRAAWPTASVAVSEATDTRLTLPDPCDTHVLAAAIDGEADELMTLNLKDFPTRTLSAEGIIRRDPDGVLMEALSQHPDTVKRVVQRVHAKAQDLAKEDIPLRALLKRARLPRLGKALQ